MKVLLVYDINIDDKGKRLRDISNICETYGIRVQNSVFELNIDIKTLDKILEQMSNILDDHGSIRVYKIKLYKIIGDSNITDYEYDTLIY